MGYEIIERRPATMPERQLADRLAASYAREMRATWMLQVVSAVFLGLLGIIMGMSTSWVPGLVALAFAAFLAMFSRVTRANATVVPIKDVVVVRARCRTVAMRAKLTTYWPYVGPFQVVVDQALLRRWPQDTEAEVVLAPCDGDLGNLNHAIVLGITSAPEMPKTTEP